MTTKQQNLITLRISEGVSLKEIAEEVGCAYKTVQRYKAKLTEENNPSAFRQRKALMISEFLGQRHYDELVKEFREDELESYVDYYFTYRGQFENLLGTERTQLDLAIRQYLLLNRVLRRLKIDETLLEVIANDLNKVVLKFQDLNDNDPQKMVYREEKNSLFANIQSTSQRIKDLNKQALEFEKNQRDALDKLNATRKSRLEQGTGIDKTWSDLIKSLEDKRNRDLQGQMAERLRIAQERQAKKMRKLEKFADDTEDYLLLDGETEIVEEEAL